MRRRLPHLWLTAALVAAALAAPVAASAQDPGPVAAALTASGDVNLVSQTNDAPAFSSAADGFGEFQRGVSASIPFSLLDDSAGEFPADDLGIVGATDTDPFFGITDTENGDNSGPVTATYTFDVAGADGLSLAADLAAMGDFEAANDQLVVAYAFDGGAATTALEMTVDEAAAQTYTLDSGDSITLDDPATVDGTALTDDFQTLNHDLTGSGDTLTLSITAQTNGGQEAMALRNLVVTTGGDGDPGDGGEQPPGPCETPDVTLISEVQGSGFASELAGETVTVRGVLTGVFPDLGGVFVQEEPDDSDGDPATSEGVFVFTGGRDLTGLAAGDRMAVTGTVTEFFELTELTDVSELSVCDTPGPRHIAPTVLHLPADTATREAHEGMVVRATNLTVTDLFGPYQFGEIGLSGDGTLTQPTQRFAPDDPRAAQLAEANAANLLVVDDGDEFGFSASPWLDDESPRAGDRVPQVVGPLTYTFGEYKVEPLEDPRILELTDRPDAPQLDAGGPRVATFNVLNLFNGDGQGGGFPTSRGAETPAEYQAQLDGIVQAIRSLDAAVVGLVELENDYGDGPDSAIAQLVDALNAAGDGTWAYVDPGVDEVGTDEIAVGIVYRSDLATEVGTPATFDIDRFLNDDVNRWPLAQSFSISGETVTLVVNHLKSKGSSCAHVATEPAFDADYAFDGDPSTALEGSCNLTRVYGANQLLEWVETDPTGAGDDDYLIGGDLNAYAEEDPIHVLEDAGWLDLVETLGGDQDTFAFDGRYGRLDHLFASPSAAGDFADADVWNINSPEPYGFLYFNLDEEGVYASSDHDPVLAAYPSADDDQHPGQGPPGGGGPPGR